MYDHGEILPEDPKARKEIPLHSGLFAYFPKALVAVAQVSQAGSKQHKTNGKWDRSKSTDHHDCILRHLMEAGGMDSDGIRHSAKVAWRALAALEVELEGKSKK